MPELDGASADHAEVREAVVLRRAMRDLLALARFRLHGLGVNLRQSQKWLEFRY